jgi:hypothetical protein
MRPDMDKIIVERPRLGGGRARKGRPAREIEEAPKSIGMMRAAKLKGDYKTLNENLTPLRRYLEKQIGRPWNKVWSEISAHLKPKSAVQQHVRDHVPDFVGVKSTVLDGEVWVHGRYSVAALKDSHVRLYVDPRSGLLRRNPHRRSWNARQKAEAAKADADAAKRMRVLSPAKQLHLLADGAWWEVELAAVPTELQEVKTKYGLRKIAVPLAVTDVVLRAGLSTLTAEALYRKAGVYAIAKRQLPSKEMRLLGLR